MKPSGEGFGGDDLALFAILSAGGMAVATWAGAQAASLATSGETFRATPASGLRALFRLPSNASNPRRAWEPDVASTLPGPVAYWTCTIVVFAMLLTVGGFVATKLLGRSFGTDRSDRLGVKPEARLARPRELRPLVLRHPVQGRFVMGKVGRRLVATEDRHSQDAATQRRRARTRVGDRSAVVVVGPSRCGKTANVTAGVLDWDGPAILSSVKDDLYNSTVARRRQLGKVFVFDPFGELPADLGPGVQRVGWSPLHASRSISGAQQAASTLLDAGPTEGVTNASYWSTKGQQLLWPMLFAASTAGLSMGDIVRWLALQDGSNGQKSEVAELLSTAAQPGRGAQAMEAKLALTAFQGFWLLDGRTRSDIFSTAQTVITAWEDPYIAAASAPSVTVNGELVKQPTMDLRQLLVGNNTLYVVQPLKSVERFAVVFGGLLGDLLRDQAYEIARQAGEPIPATLAVIDEAGNTPLRWLPDVTSTCSGVGIQLVTVWQSLAQMRSIYQAQMGSLLTNHGSKIFFSGLSDRETLEYASYLGGDEEVAQHSTTTNVGSGSDRRSVASSTTSMRLLPGDLLRQVPPGSALLLHGTLLPAHLSGRRPWEDKRLIALGNGDGPAPEAAVRSQRLLAALSAQPESPPVVVSHLRSMTDAIEHSQPIVESDPDEDDGDSDQVVDMLGRIRPRHENQQLGRE